VTEVKNGIGMFWKILQIAVLVIVVATFFLDRVVLPQVAVVKSAETAAAAAAKLAETVDIERRLTRLETNYESIEKLLTDIKKDLHDHMDKGK
jgi:p-aminobenzoyl-glutamate transporter AbgT